MIICNMINQPNESRLAGVGNEKSMLCGWGAARCFLRLYTANMLGLMCDEIVE